MRDEQFKYHVNKEKNDFWNWVRNIIEDKKLARDIEKVKTKKTMIKKIKSRIDRIEDFLKKKSASKEDKNGRK